MKKKFNKFLEYFLAHSGGFTLISILLGLIIGGVILAIAGYNPFEAYGVILSGVFGKLSYISYTIIKATPLILTGLSITFAFRTGLFNIGAEGQFIIGAATATAVGYFFDLHPLIHIPVTIILSILAAGIWGGLAGLFKARYGVHEVISTIMLNWIALYFQNFLTRIDGFHRPNSETTFAIKSTASLTIFEKWKQSDSGLLWLAEHPLLKDLFRTPVNAGIFVALITALIVWFILNKTTLGFKLRAVGLNKDAAKYGGINVSSSTVTSMFIAGGLAGLGGAIFIMGVTKNIQILGAMEGHGFDGIAVSLIGGNTAGGCIWAALLFGALKYGGHKIQPFMNAPSEIINIVIGTIVLFVAMPKMIKMMTQRIARKIERGR